ncbi:MAG TPA: hypothetical protein VFY36_08455 [Solirubrobacteraceae bacterium]|nr:hypothetical protein [Solirubrobacteraceae bacterium]
MVLERITWTFHAEERLSQRGLTRARVERAIQELHPIREINKGRAAWRVDAGSFVVVYDRSASLNSIRIVSVWVKRRPRRRRAH